MVTQVSARPPLGARNNNPLNIRWGIPYEGLASPPQIEGFCNFQSPVWGFRAAFRNFITKYDRGVNTLRALITEWAPPSENDTAAYIKAVCDDCGIGPDDKIPLKSWEIAKQVCYAMTVHEQGSFETFFTIEQMSEGAFRAGIVDAPAPFVHKVATTVAAAGSAAASVAGVAASSIQTMQPNLPQTHSIQIGCAIAAAVLGAIAAWWNMRHKREVVA